MAATLVVGGAAGTAATALVSRGGSSPTATATAAVSATPAATSSTTTTVGTIVAKVEPALVDIHATTTSDSDSQSLFGNGMNPFGGSSSTTEEDAGTGMIISSGGLILTNAHVVEGATSITITLNGQTSTHPAKLVGIDTTDDVAVIQAEGVSGLPTVSFGDSSQSAVGESVLTIGNALDLQQGGFSVSTGIISGLNRSITAGDSSSTSENLTGLLQTDAAISSGDSGGPLLNSAGQVIGMNTASAASTGTNTAQNIGFSIPVNKIKSLLPELENGAHIGTSSSGNSSSSSTNSPFGDSGGQFGSGFGNQFS